MYHYATLRTLYYLFVMHIFIIRIYEILHYTAYSQYCLTNKIQYGFLHIWNFRTKS